MFDSLLSAPLHRQPAGCRIKVDGRELTELYGLVSDVSVEASRQTASSATVVFAAPVDEKGVWQVQDKSNLHVGSKIRIDATFGMLTEEVFRGFIQQVSPSYPEDRGQARVTLTCRDDTLPLDRNHRTKVWERDAPTSDAAILSQIIANTDLLPYSRNDRGQSNIRPSQNSSDMTFLRERANANGYEIYTRGGYLHFKSMQLGAAPQPAIMVYAGRRTNCLRFEPLEDTHHPDSISADVARPEGDGVEVIEVQSDLPLLGQRAATGTGSAAGANAWRFGRATSPDATAVRAQAQAHVNSAAMRVTATGELDGALYGHVLRFGEPVLVDGAGDEWSGLYYVDKVSHSFSTTGYRQRFTVSRNARGATGAVVGNVLTSVLGLLA